MPLQLLDRGDFYEIRDWTGGINDVLDALAEAKDKPLYFTIDFQNETATQFYRKLVETGRIEMTHIVCRKVR